MTGSRFVSCARWIPRVLISELPISLLAYTTCPYHTLPILMHYTVGLKFSVTVRKTFFRQTGADLKILKIKQQNLTIVSLLNSRSTQRQGLYSLINDLFYS